MAPGAGTVSPCRMYVAPCRSALFDGCARDKKNGPGRVSAPGPSGNEAIERSLHLGLAARRIVGLEVAERVLDPGEDVLEHRPHRVDPLAVAVGLVEHAALAFTTDPAQA